MPKPRYDEDENVSRHAAASEGDCEKMASKYRWELVEVEKPQKLPSSKLIVFLKAKPNFQNPIKKRSQTSEQIHHFPG
jgi:hypothetical protein